MKNIIFTILFTLVATFAYGQIAIEPFTGSYMADTTLSQWEYGKGIQFIEAGDTVRLFNPITYRLYDDNFMFYGHNLRRGASYVKASSTDLGLTRSQVDSVLSAINPVNKWYSVSDSTDTSGDVLVEHPFGTSDFAALASGTDTVFYNIQIHSKTDTTLKARFFDAAGAAITEQPVNFDIQISN